MLLFESSKIRKRIKAILSRGSGRRVALVAYVGRDALKFIPEPEGVEIYCSDNPIATNPVGILKLLNGQNGSRGASIWFADALHMKVFWSERGGALVGSPNLSENALGDGGLMEAAYFVADSSAIDIDALIKDIRSRADVRRVTDSVLADFKRRHDLALDLRRLHESDSSADVPELPSYAANEFRAPFKVAIWSARSESTIPQRAVAKHDDIAVTEAERMIVDSIVDLDPIFKQGDWVLAIKLNDAYKVTASSWFFVDRALPQGERDQVIVEMRGGRRGSPPFVFDPMLLRSALTRAASRRPETFDRSFKPSVAFIRRLSQYYSDRVDG